MDVVLVVLDFPKAIQGDGANVENGRRAEVNVREYVDVAKGFAQRPFALFDSHVKTGGWKSILVTLSAH